MIGLIRLGRPGLSPQIYPRSLAIPERFHVRKINFSHVPYNLLESQVICPLCCLLGNEVVVQTPLQRASVSNSELLLYLPLTAV